MIPIIPILFVAPKLALVAKIVHSRRKAAKIRRAEEARGAKSDGQKEGGKHGQDRS